MNISGKFIKDKYTKTLAIVLYFSEENSYLDTLIKISKEVFIRVSYSSNRLIVRSVGDERSYNEYPDLSKCNLLLEVNSIDHTETLEFLSNSERIIYISLFKDNVLEKTARLSVNKDSEYIHSREFYEKT